MTITPLKFDRKTHHSSKWPMASLWYPDEALLEPSNDGVRDVMPAKKRQLRAIPTLNRKLWNTIEKNGCWVNAQWPCLVMNLIDVGMRKRNLSFREDHKRNLENMMRWMAYNSDTVTGCINVTHLCAEIGTLIGVSNSTLYYMLKEFFVMGILDDAPNSGVGIQDVLHGGCLPRTLCLTPLYYELLGIDGKELSEMRNREKARRHAEAVRLKQKYDADASLQKFCHDNILRVWEHRHTQTTSSYKIKLADMPPLERLGYISKKLAKRILEKGWNISTDKKTITKMANNLLYRMGLAVRAGNNPSPNPA